MLIENLSRLSRHGCERVFQEKPDFGKPPASPGYLLGRTPRCVAPNPFLTNSENKTGVHKVGLDMV